MAYGVLVVGVVVLVLLVATLKSAVHVVREGRIEALLVFGQMQAVLEPGLNVVPPFVSTTYPIDPRTARMDTGEETVAVPAEFEEEIRSASEDR